MTQSHCLYSFTNSWYSYQKTNLNIKNSVFIVTSLDRWIADKNGRIDSLYSIPNSDNVAMGYVEFNKGIDALIIGWIIFETLLEFDVDWPFNKAVFLVLISWKKTPKSHKRKAFLVKGTLTEILHQIHKKGFNKLYIDEGARIQNFLKEDLIDEMVITIISVFIRWWFFTMYRTSKRTEIWIDWNKKISDSTDAKSLQMKNNNIELTSLNQRHIFFFF